MITQSRMSRYPWLFILILCLMPSGCSGDSAANQEQDPPAQIEKSPKRGLAYNLTAPEDLEALKNGVSWWYNWYFETGAPAGYRLQKYGKQIWITEMANWNAQIDSYEKQAEQMQQMVALCESRSDVFRYAWFIGRGNLPDNHFTYLFNPTPGELNALGELYLSLPYAK